MTDDAADVDTDLADAVARRKPRPKSSRPLPPWPTHYAYEGRSL